VFFSVIDVDKLLASPILTRDNIDIKFKRTNQMIDRSSFILKILMNDRQDRIIEGRLRLYITLLVGTTVSYTILDLSTTTEQVFLVQCNNPIGKDFFFFHRRLMNNFNSIEFEKIRQQHQSKPQLQGKDISLSQIYECETVTIRYTDENRIMKYEDIETIIRFVRKNVFTFQLIDNNSGEVEFINTDGKIQPIQQTVYVLFLISAFKDWMLTVERTKTRYNIMITPVIENIDDKDDNESNPDSAQSIPFNIGKPHTTTIKLRSEWAMVAAHHVFGVEYKEYIRNYYEFLFSLINLFIFRG
jgi:hypothetical protein